MCDVLSVVRLDVVDELSWVVELALTLEDEEESRPDVITFMLVGTVLGLEVQEYICLLSFKQVSFIYS